uniref:Uncharacterized protein n=1 Tax=Helianthus annuus TaxID=4232 RepID=A0A251U8B7_HELAN
MPHGGGIISFYHYTWSKYPPLLYFNSLKPIIICNESTWNLVLWTITITASPAEY